jgi:hypothetical protein
MAKKSKGNVIGAWAFLVGVVLALVLGLFSMSQLGSRVYTALMGILILAGVLVGLFNVKAKETTKFLLAALSLVIVSAMGQAAIATLSPFTIGYLSIADILASLLNALLLLFVPTTIIVALKSVFEVAKN